MAAWMKADTPFLAAVKVSKLVTTAACAASMRLRTTDVALSGMFGLYGAGRTGLGKAAFQIAVV